MRISPTISFEQYRDTCKAVAGAKPKVVRKRSWNQFLRVAVISLLIGISLQIPATRVPALTIFIALILCWILIKPLARRSQDKSYRTIFSEEQGTLNDQILTITESGISCERAGGKVTSHHNWNAFRKRIDMPDAYVFLPSPNSFIRIPKELLTPAQLELVWQWSSSILTVDGL